MRIAEAQRKFKHVYSKEYPARLTSFGFENITTLRSGTITFTGGISVICGANGVGKSTILRAIYCGLTKDKYSDPRFGQPKLSSTIYIAGKETKIELDYSQVDDTPLETYLEIEFIDPSKSALSLVSFFSQQRNLDEWKESVSPIEFSEKELETLSQMVGKKYDSLKIYELDDVEGVDESPLPYFEVITNGKEYGTPTMGLGELALLYTYWRLDRSEQEAIILLEEPDTHLSYSSQEELFNIIARYSDEKNLWVILTTHSTAIASKVPRQNMILLYSHNGDTVIVQNPPLYQVLRMLGLPEKKNGLLLVEDDEAEDLLKALISIFDPSILKQYAIINLGNTGQIISSLKRIPLELGFQVVGVFDADMRNSPDIPNDLPWSHIFLPGEGSPEHVFMRIANTWHENFSKNLPRDHHELRALLGEIEAQEHHNWLDRICERLGLEKTIVIYTLTKVWSEIDSEREQLIAFITQLQVHSQKQE